MKICTLLSGSKGNCTLVTTEQLNILIDCGGSYTRIKQQLKKLGYSLSDIDSVLITHTHIDHIYALPMIVEKYPHIKVYIHTDSGIDLTNRVGITARVFDDKFALGNLIVDSYRCHHDTVCCTGYRISDGNSSIACVTDTGCVDEALLDFLRGVEHILIESNHDYTMLINGPYPYILKKRINGQNGHLSNEQTAYLLENVLPYGTKSVILGHLSEINNLPDLALHSAQAVADKLGCKVKISAASQWEICED